VIDLIYLAHNRLEFTKASLAALEANTNWALVDQFVLYDDNSTDGTREYLSDWIYSARIEARIVPRFGEFGHPVNVMRDFLTSFRRHSIFAKIDSDTMVPPGWLDESFDVMERHPELDLLGIEVHNGVDPSTKERGYTDARFIGGIGLMRTSAFRTLPEPNGPYFGFTEWQEGNPQVKKGWIDPAMPVFLLDRLPMEPWRSLSKEYVKKFGQRDWPPYSQKSTDLWFWWQPAQQPAREEQFSA
jgi:glycosyl transferase family 2